MPKFEYVLAPESRAIVSLRESYGLFIDGEFSPGVDGRAFKTISPATEEVLAEVTEAVPPTWTVRYRRPQGLRAHLVATAGEGTRQVPVPDRPDRSGEGA